VPSARHPARCCARGSADDVRQSVRTSASTACRKRHSSMPSARSRSECAGVASGPRTRPARDAGRAVKRLEIAEAAVVLEMVGPDVVSDDRRTDFEKRAVALIGFDHGTAHRCPRLRDLVHIATDDERRSQSCFRRLEAQRSTRSWFAVRTATAIDRRVRASAARFPRAATPVGPAHARADLDVVRGYGPSHRHELSRRDGTPAWRPRHGYRAHAGDRAGDSLRSLPLTRWPSRRGPMRIALIPGTDAQRCGNRMGDDRSIDRGPAHRRRPARLGTSSRRPSCSCRHCPGDPDTVAGMSFDQVGRLARPRPAVHDRRPWPYGAAGTIAHEAFEYLAYRVRAWLRGQRAAGLPRKASRHRAGVGRLVIARRVRQRHQHRRPPATASSPLSMRPRDPRSNPPRRIPSLSARIESRRSAARVTRGRGGQVFAERRHLSAILRPRLADECDEGRRHLARATRRPERRSSR